MKAGIKVRIALNAEKRSFCYGSTAANSRLSDQHAVKPRPAPAGRNLGRCWKRGHIRRAPCEMVGRALIRRANTWSSQHVRRVAIP